MELEGGRRRHEEECQWSVPHKCHTDVSWRVSQRGWLIQYSVSPHTGGPSSHCRPYYEGGHTTSRHKKYHPGSRRSILGPNFWGNLRKRIQSGYVKITETSGKVWNSHERLNLGNKKQGRLLFHIILNTTLQRRMGNVFPLPQKKKKHREKSFN